MNEDRFANHLDDIVTEKPSCNPDDLAAFASQIQNAHGPDVTSALDTDQRNAIWRNLMSAHAPEVPTTGGPGPLSQPAITAPTAFNPWAPKRSWPHKKTTRLGIVQPYLQTAITTSALLAIIIAGFAGYTAIRDNRAPEITPTAFAAAPTQSAESIASASPDAEGSEWLSWIEPEECTSEPMSREEYANIMREEPDISGRSYDVVGPAEPGTAEAAARAARTHEACALYGSIEQKRVLETPLSIFYLSASANRTLSIDDKASIDFEHGQQLSEQFPNREPSAYAVIMPDDPPEEIRERLEQNPSMYVSFYYTYNPANAMELEDGRIAIPSAFMYWEDNPYILAPTQEQIDESTRLSTGVVILSNPSGEWLVDEQLFFCSFEDCDAFWDERGPLIGATPRATPIATPAD